MIFRGATKFVDSDLAVKPDPNALRTYKLASLYERYYEYADLLATQGLVKDAVDYLKLVPSDHQSTGGTKFDFTMARERLLGAANVSQAPTSITKQAAAPMASIASTSTIPAQSGPYGIPQYGAQRNQGTSRGPQYAAYTGTSSAPSQQAVNPYNTAASQQTNAYAAPATSQQANPYAPQTVPAPIPPTQAQSFDAGPYAPPPGQVSVPAPPPPISSAPSRSNVPPPPPKRDASGWNDAPVLDRRTPVSGSSGKAAIVSPFPNSTPPSIPGSPMHGQGTLPPPPRPGSVSRGLSQGPPPMRGPPGGPQGMYGQSPRRSVLPGILA